jgi:hypothetical protein
LHFVVESAKEIKSIGKGVSVAELFTRREPTMVYVCNAGSAGLSVAGATALAAVACAKPVMGLSKAKALAPYSANKTAFLIGVIDKCPLNQMEMVCDGFIVFAETLGK